MSDSFSGIKDPAVERQNHSSVISRFCMMLFRVSLFSAVLSSLTTLVAGHGYVQEVTLGSAKYTGYLPYQDPYYNPPPQRIIRKVPGNGMSPY